MTDTGQAYRGRFQHPDPVELLLEIEKKLSELKFKTEKKNQFLVSMRGPGMNSTKQSALRGITSADFRADGDLVKVDAQIAEHGKLLRFVLFCIFVPFALVIIGLAALQLQMVAIICGLVFAINVVAWLFLMPWFVGHHRKRTVLALESMMKEIGVSK
jgi:hypothetical protein